MNNLINNSYEDTIKDLRLQCKYLKSENKWLDELANYERDVNRYEKCEEDEAWSKEIDELYIDSEILKREWIEYRDNLYKKEVLTKTK